MDIIINRKLHKIGAVLLCSAMLMSTAACSGNPSSSASTPSSQTAASSGKQEAPETIDPYKKFDPPITLSTYKIEGNHEFPEGEDYGNNDVYKLFESDIGVKLTNKILAPDSAFKEKFQMAIASNDIPDFGPVDADIMRTLIKNDLVEDMTDVYETWASYNLKQVTEEHDKAYFAPVLNEGRYMGVPLAGSIADEMPILWVRSDWLKALNLETPKTVEELFEAATAFATKDPDGNGKNDTYAICIDKDLSSLKYLFASFGVYGDQWIKQADGTFKAGYTDPGMKDALKALQDLYAVGGIDPEFAVKDSAKAEENVAAGKIGMYIGRYYHPFMLKDCVLNVPGSNWTPIMIPASEKIDMYRAPVGLNTRGYLYAKKGISNPESLVVMMNYVCDSTGAPWLVGEDTEFAKANQKIAADPKYKNASINYMMPFTIYGTVNWGPIFQEAIDKGETHMFGKDEDFQNVINTDQPAEMQWAWKNIYLKGYPVLGDFTNIHYDDYNGSPTETALKVQSLLDKERITTFIGIIMGDKPVDEFDHFVERYNSIGATKIAEEIRQYFEQ